MTTTTSDAPTTEAVPGLMEKIVNYFKRNPEQLEMNYWGLRDGETACGTTACLAGEALILTDNAQWYEAGRRYLYTKDNQPILDENGDHKWVQRWSLGATDAKRDFPEDRDPYMRGDWSEVIERRGQLLLGISKEDAHRLFHASTDEVGSVVKELTGIDWDTSNYEDLRYEKQQQLDITTESYSSVEDEEFDDDE